MRENYKKIGYAIGVIFLALMAVVFAAYKYRDSSDYLSFSLQEFEIPDELQGHVTDDGVFSYQAETGGKQQFVLRSPLMWMREGEYIIGIGYKSTSDNNYCELYSEHMMDEEGNIGVLFDSRNLEKGEGRIYFYPSFDQDVSNLEVRIYYNEGDLEITDMTLRNTKKVTDPFWLYGFGFLAILITACLVLHWKHTPQYPEKIILVIGFWVLMYLTMAPFLNDYMIIGHDLKFHMARVNGIAAGIRNGDLWVRINPIQSYGYGYASSVMYPQLFIYPAALLRAAGMSLMNSYKCMLFFIQILTIGSSYFSFGRIFNSKKAGMMGTFLYVLSMIRLSNLFVRGDIGEVLSMMFFPLVFYAMYEIIIRDYTKWYWAAVSFAGIFLSHILSTETVIITTVVYCLVSVRRFYKEPKRIVALGKAALLAVLLCLWQIVPILSYIGEGFIVMGDQLIYLPDRLVRGTELFRAFAPNGYWSVGVILGIGALLYIIIAVFVKQKGHLTEKEAGLLTVGNAGLMTAVVTMVMTLWIFPWHFLCRIAAIDWLIKSIQFPWRLLSITNFMLCVVTVCAAMLWLEKRSDYEYFLTLIICLGSIISSLYFIDSATDIEAIENRAEAEYINLTDFLYFYQGNEAAAFEYRGSVITTNQDNEWKITDYKKKGTRVDAVLSAQDAHKDSWVEVPLYYYPGYHASLDDVEVKVEQGTDGMVRVIIPDEFNEGRLAVWFEDLTAWKIADWISVLTLFVCIGCVVYYGGRKKNYGHAEQ